MIIQSNIWRYKTIRYHFQHDTSIPRHILKDRRYDAFVFNHERDNQAKDEVANFLKEKGLTLCCESDRIGESPFNFSEQLNNSRWTILILSKSALNDPLFSHCCFMLVGEFLRSKRLGIIPVLTDAGHEDIPEAIRIVTYTAVDSDRMYLERILTTLRGKKAFWLHITKYENNLTNIRR